MPDFMTLGSLFTGSLVKLTARRPEDKDALARWTLDAEYMRQLNRRPVAPQSPEQFERKKEDRHESNVFHFMFRTLADDKLIGWSGIEADWSNQRCEIWLGIGEADYRSKGYGTDAMRLLVNYSFRELGLYRVGLIVFSYNTRAVRSYEKLGFVHEGAQREAVYRDGQRWDVFGMSILRPEWQAQRAITETAERLS